MFAPSLTQISDMELSIQALEVFNKSFDNEQERRNSLAESETGSQRKRRRTDSPSKAESAAKRQNTRRQDVVQDAATNVNISELPGQTPNSPLTNAPEPHIPATYIDHNASKDGEKYQQDQWAAQAPQNGLSIKQCRQRKSLDLSKSASADTWADAVLQLKICSLPILDNLATQILQTLSRGTFQEAFSIVSETQSVPGRAFAALKPLFDHTKKLYLTSGPFISIDELGFREPEYCAVLRKANLATFVSSVFGSQDVGFYHLNESFLDIFVPENLSLLKPQGSLYLDLKTQAYISAMANGERSRAELLNDLFPDDLGQRLLIRRYWASQTTPSETEFVVRAHRRRIHLLKESETEEAIALLPEKYVWENFVRDVSAYINKNYLAIVEQISQEIQFVTIGPQPAISGHSQVNSHVTNDEDSARAAEDAAEDAELFESLKAHIQASEEQDLTQEEILKRATRAAEIALRNVGFSYVPSPQAGDAQLAQPSEEFHDTPNTERFQNSESFQGEHQAQAYIQHHDHSGTQEYGQVLERSNSHGIENDHTLQAQGDHLGQGIPSDGNNNTSSASPYGELPPGIPYYTQSAPTQVLYERARLVATSKISANNRRGGSPSQRRPWTTEEENSLMAGLDRVKGPHWSQILAMFGAGGTINESLKDRNQVQLKDKARNLKLFFLKSGIEVPYYLQFVTGDLKTRAPGQMAKQEAAERDKIKGDEDRAHIQGVMALANVPRDSLESPVEENSSAYEQDESNQTGLEDDSDLGFERRLTAEIQAMS